MIYNLSLNHIKLSLDKGGYYYIIILYYLFYIDLRNELRPFGLGVMLGMIGGELGLFQSKLEFCNQPRVFQLSVARLQRV